MLVVDSQCKEVPGTTEHIAAHSTSQNTLTLVCLCKQLQVTAIKPAVTQPRAAPGQLMG